MTGKPTTLGDLAHVFHGVGNADIFTPEKLAKSNNQKEVDECRVIKASDVTSQRVWQQPESIARMHVSKRLASSTARRGLGQSCVLQTGDLLLTTRGKPKVSPMITHEMIKNGAIVAGPEILVIRAKEGVYCATLREAMRQKSATLYFAETTTKKNKDKAEGKGWDKSGVLSKEAASNLPIPEGLTNMPPRFGQDVEILSHKAELLITFIKSLNHAIVEAARWRSEGMSESIEVARFDFEKTEGLSWYTKYKAADQEIASRQSAKSAEISEAWDPRKSLPDWEWIKPFQKERKKLSEMMDKWASIGLCKAIDNIRLKSLSCADTELLCQLLCGEIDPDKAKHAILNSARLLESTTILAHQGDRRASSLNVSRSIRTLLAYCAESTESAMVLSAETGHLAVETISRFKGLKRLSLVEEYEPHRKVAKSLCELASQGAEVFDVEKAYLLPEGKNDIVLMEASGFEMDKNEDDEKARRTSQNQFQWNQIEHRIKPSGCMIAHLPTTHWRLLESVKDKITMVIQLPPLSLPTWSKRSGNNYTPCDQGFIVVLRPGFRPNDTVKLVDATKLNNGAAASSLTPEQILDLRDILRGDTEPSGQVHGTDIPRSELFKEMRIWPGISTLMKKKVEADDLAQAYTLETLVEEFKYRHFLWKKTEIEIFRDIGLQSDF